jgi:hypothetical protein
VTTSCSLSLAGLGVTLECDDAALIDQLCLIYRAFSTDDDVRLTARINPIGYAPVSNDKPVLFRDGVLHFTSANYNGFIDLGGRRGELFISTTQPAEDVEYFLRAAYALLVFEAGGLLFHAAGLARRGRGYAFFGHSGSGKTTVARAAIDEVVLNDDLVALMPTQAAEVSTDLGSFLWSMHATPFSNPTQLTPSGPQQVQLVKLLRLVQDTRVYLEDLPPGQAVAEVVSNTPIIPIDPSRTLQLVDRAQRLVQAVPAYRLHFLPDDSFWGVVE